MKADKNFRLSKTTKRIMSSILDKDARKVFKDVMIEGQLSYEANKKKAPRQAKDE